MIVAIIFVRTLIIYICVMFAMRFMGKRQLGELAPHELVITILISSVATIPLQSNDTPLSSSIIPIAMLISFEILQSVLSMKSLKFRYFMQGRPIFIIKNGVLQQKAFKKLRLSLDDIIDALRQQEVFDINEVENAIIETNGALSVQKKAQYDTITPNTIGLKVKDTAMPITIVMDGAKINEYFSDEKFIDSEIELIVTANNQSVKDIMYMSIDEDGNSVIIKKDKN